MRKIIFILITVVVICSLFSCSNEKIADKMPTSEIKGAYEPQLNFLNIALEDDPNDDELLFKRAQIYFNLYRTKEALIDINKAINENSTNPDYYLLSAQLNFFGKKYFETIKASEKAERLGLNNPELVVLQARVYWAIKDTISFNRYVTKAEKLVPLHSNLLLLKGEQAALKGDSTKAITYYLASIQNDRKNIDTYQKLIELYLHKLKFDSALYYTINAKMIDPRNPDYFYAEGIIFENKNLEQSALLSYENCIKQDSSYSQAYYRLGAIHYKNGNLIAALTSLEKNVSILPTNKDALEKIIAILKKQNNENASVKYYEKLIQIDTSNISLKYTLQKLYKKLKSTTVDTVKTFSNLEVNDDSISKPKKPVRRSNNTSDTIQISNPTETRKNDTIN